MYEPGRGERLQRILEGVRSLEAFRVLDTRSGVARARIPGKAQFSGQIEFSEMTQQIGHILKALQDRLALRTALQVSKK